MVPFNNNNFSHYSLITAPQDVAKLSVIFFVSILLLLFFMLALFGKMREGDDLYQDELRR